MIDASWIIVERATNKAILETFNFELCQFVNIDKYEVVPIIEWLYRLNRKQGKLL